jgi:hypothetical protein
MNLRKWFLEAWPFADERVALAGEYQAMKHLTLALADIGLRASLWDNPPPPASVYEAGVNDGRRQLALEIFRICEADPRLIFQAVPARRYTTENA